MASSRRKCSNDPNTFCYRCGEYTLKDQRRGIPDFVRKAYFDYFKVKLGDQDKPWAPHIVCKTCNEYIHREEGLPHYFSQQEGLVFCNDIEGLLLEMGVPQYKPEDWRLLIDSSKRSLKCVLLHNGNKYASIPTGHSTKLKVE
ncbi:hypothetical protein LOD99_10864 [Oopsacas minuta]|uniref:Uncharacterized protein n=1 Tax=Oopsacas minuta TaxID=111878 RepID=A0AAV7KDY9_9METZ|nr:hypothetical protein LOD99_10864 [Oopsacas minuta]